MATKAYAKHMADAVREEMQRDENVVYLGEDVGPWGGTLSPNPKLHLEFPGRVIQTPIDEAGFAGMAVGMSWGGLRPIVELMFADFFSLAFDQVVNSGAKMWFNSAGETSTPLVFRSVQGIGAQCGGVHSQCVEGWLNNIPGLKLIAPTFPYDAKGLLKYAVRNDDPVIFLESRTSLYKLKAEIGEEDYTIPFGRANIVREGTDVTVVAWHRMLLESIAAAEDLEKQGISVEIIDPRSLVPLDTETILASVAKTGRLVVAHESPRRGGMGGEIAAVVAEEGFAHLKAPIARVGNDGVVIPVGMVEYDVMPDRLDVLWAIKRLLGVPLLPEEKTRTPKVEPPVRREEETN